jgi:CRISPR-associated protein Csm1
MIFLYSYKLIIEGVNVLDKQLLEITMAGLLHDIGKPIFRASNLDSRAHPVSGTDFVKKFTQDKGILEAIRYHHAKDLNTAKLDSNSAAYVVYYADNIASGVDRRKIEGEDDTLTKFDKSLALSTVFNLLNDNNGKMMLDATDAEAINLPTPKAKISESEYNLIVQRINEGLSAIKFEPEYINSLIELLEAYLTYIPSSTVNTEVADISLFDHQKLTAAIAANVYLYLTQNNRENFKALLFENEESFRDEKAYIMYSCDISGIQKFIYTISSKGALKGLRSRSFYLEMLLQHIIDCLLDECGLSRANLIYSGGGHAYILMPNTESIKAIIRQSMANANTWMIQNFGTALYIAGDYQECSSNDLMNKPYKDLPYSNIFKSLAVKLSKAKQKRYSANEIRRLNAEKPDEMGRECNICGSIDCLIDTNDGKNICFCCNSLKNISSDIIDDNKLLLTTNVLLSNNNYLILPSIHTPDEDNYLYALSESEVKKLLSQQDSGILKVYGKNKMLTGLRYGTKLWVGTYHYNIKGNIATFEDLANGSTGIERLGVLRADVDYLGTAFVSGFVRAKETDMVEKYRYLTISRTATLSRQLSLFFKLHINKILSCSVSGLQPFSLISQNQQSEREAVIVYSGGDDLFVVGAWNEIIETAVDLRNAFEKYTTATLTFSAGIGIFPGKYPISRMAIETQDLEDAAKRIDSDKNAISLFGLESFIDFDGEHKIGAQHTYKWDVFINNVAGEKLKLLQGYFSMSSDMESASGNSFLYKLMGYVRDIQNDPINIARLAYILGRMAPKKDDEEKTKAYRLFSTEIYKWIFNLEDRKQLLTAINLFVYLDRKKNEEE